MNDEKKEQSMLKHDVLNLLFSNLQLGDDGIYTDMRSIKFSSQKNEVLSRKSVAKNQDINFLSKVSKHHSIPVMDKEIRNFLRGLPLNSIVLDIGGCLGWHWRKIEIQRPDVIVVIVDFVRESLINARNLLRNLINNQVYLVEANALSLPFDECVFDAVWSVQALQHIPESSIAISESYRVLKQSGQFVNYSLHKNITRFFYKIFSKKYHCTGINSQGIFLNRASDAFEEVVSNTFGKRVIKRYSEVIFFPEFGFVSPGKESSFLGKIDALLTSKYLISSLLARQCSYHITK